MDEIESDWMSYDVEQGISFHATEAEAVAEANRRISSYLDSGGWWREGVESVVVVRVAYSSVEVKTEPPDSVKEEMQRNPEYRPPFDEYARYELARRS